MTITLSDAISQLTAAAQPGRSAEMAAYHKIERPYLGVANPDTNEIVKNWRTGLSVDQRVSLARELWNTNIFEARLAAAKLLTQARMRPDQAAWDLICDWVVDFDSWAIADHAAIAGQKRLVADPTRLDQVETWAQSPDKWTRRAALVFTLPWTKQNYPKPAEIEARERILGWAAGFVDDPDWFIQKSVAWWVRDLSKHDPERSRAFLRTYGNKMKPFARKEAARNLV